MSSERYRPGATALALALRFLIVAGSAQAADEPVIRIDCERGVCGFNTADAALLAEPCKGVVVLAVYRKAGGLAVIRCGEGADRQPLVCVFDRRAAGGPVFELEGARVVKAAFLAEAAVSGVPGRCLLPAAARRDVRLLTDDGGDAPPPAAAGMRERWAPLVARLQPFMQR